MSEFTTKTVIAKQTYGKIEIEEVNTQPLSIISVENAKTQLRVDHDEDDGYIEMLILSAFNTIGTYCGIVPTSTKIKYTTYTSSSKGVRLPYQATTVYSVTDSDDAAVDYEVYELDAYDTYVQFDQELENVYEIIFDTGYTRENIPPAFKEAAYLMIDHWYEIRELVTNRGPESIPLMLDLLLDTYRRITI